MTNAAAMTSGWRAWMTTTSAAGFPIRGFEGTRFASVGVGNFIVILLRCNDIPIFHSRAFDLNDFCGGRRCLVSRSHSLGSGESAYFDREPRINGTQQG